MRTHYILALVLLFLFSCSRDKSNFRIECQVKGSKGTMFHLERRTLSGIVPVDSAMPDKSGKCILNGYTKIPDFFVIYLQPRHYINVIVHPGDKFKVLSDASTFDYNYLVEGSKDSRLIQKLVEKQSKTMGKITELTNEYENNRDKPNFEHIKVHIDSIYNKVLEDHRQFSIQLIKENPGSLASLITLYQQLGRNTPVFDYKKDFRYYEMVDSNLTALYPQLDAVIDLNRKLTEISEQLKLEPGESAPELSLPDINSKKITLSSLRGKNVLLVFWASWSSESREFNKNLVSVYKNYQSKGLEIYQVSLDRTHESWLKGITDDKLPGIQVCDLKYWDSPAVEKYKISKLPALFLIDRKGKIISPYLQISDLEQQLNDLFNASKK